jgi:hypothetical protein
MRLALAVLLAGCSTATSKPPAPAASAQVLRADIRAARGDHAGAVAAYNLWLRDHAQHEERDAVIRKRNAALAR